MKKKVKNVLIVGATSSIARAAAMAFAEKGVTLYLAGRDAEELERISTDIAIRYETKSVYSILDIEDIESHKTFFQKVTTEMPQLDGILFAVGYMGEAVDKMLKINFTAAVLFLELFADYLEVQKSGFMIGISSCAGDRGRKSNYLYGAAKGGLSMYLQGLRNKLFKSHVRVITIKPGFVDTQMTFGMPHLFLVASPQKIGKVIANTAYKKKDIYYLPWFWRYIMLMIKIIPESLFKRMSL